MPVYKIRHPLQGALKKGSLAQGQRTPVQVAGIPAAVYLSLVFLASTSCCYVLDHYVQLISKPM
jgi:hypothetical protein